VAYSEELAERVRALLADRQRDRAQDVRRRSTPAPDTPPRCRPS